MIHFNRKISFLAVLTILSVTSCLKFVDDGIRVEYEDSNADLIVTNLGNENGAADETVSFSILVRSDFDIKSVIVLANIEGKNGTGFNVNDTNFDDPFADHNFGTIRPGIRSFKIRYDYIIPEGTNKSIISFTTIDESGKRQEEKIIQIVPGIQYHNDIKLYAKNSTFHDALASATGNTYEDIKTNYSLFTEANVEIQKLIDIVFFYNPNSKIASLVSPASDQLGIELFIENETLFKKLNLPVGTELANMSASELAELAEEAKININGRSDINGIKVGEYIGFVADLNAANSLTAGILKVEGLHPGSVARYDGISYVLECSLIIQN